MNAAMRRLVPYALIVLVGLAAYLPSTGGGFVWKDYDGVVSNPSVKTWGRSLIPFSPGNWVGERAGELPLPLVSLTYTLDYSLFRMDARGYRFTNLALHLCVAALLFFFAGKLRSPEESPALPLLAALLFAVYPRTMENAAWISGRGGILAAAVLLYGLILIHDGTRKLNVKLAVLFTLGAFSDPSAAVLPVFWGAYALFRDGWKLERRSIGKFYALYVLAAGYLVLLWRFSVFEAAYPGLIKSLSMFVQRLGGYLFLVLLPYGVNPVRVEPSPYWVVLALAALVAVVIAFRRAWNVSAFLLSGLLFSILVPSFAAESVRFADQRVYMACVPACLLYARLLGRFRLSSWLLASVVLFNIIIINHNSKVYAEGRTFWEYSFARNKSDATVMLNLGKFYLTEGEIDKATALFQKAAGSSGSAAYAYTNLGIVEQQRGELDKAEEHFNMAIELSPGYFEPYLNRGGVYFLKDLGDKALADWERARELAPDRPEVYNNLGIYYARNGKLSEAKGFFYEAEKIDPEFIEPRENLAVIHLKLGQYEMYNEERYRISQIRSRRQVVNRAIKAD